MICPYCQTENREDRESCYACGKDISTLRLVVNKARQHYNDALEHAERGRDKEAIDELKNAIELDWSLVNAHVVLGTMLARNGQFAEARESWQNALALQPEMQRAHDYLERVDSVEASIPTMRFYRWIALVMLLIAIGLSIALIYKARPESGGSALRQANTLLAQNQVGDAAEKLGEAQAVAQPGGIVSAAATALDRAIKLDIEQRLRVIQDLKYRQMYPEALETISALEKETPDEKTRAVLETVRNDITYYYHSLIAQLYSAYEQGDLDFETLRGEIQRFIALYPSLPEADEIRGYLDRAERMEVQAALDDLRRKFMMDYNVETAVQGISDLAATMDDIPSFQQERQAFVENVLSTLFSLYTGYLDQEDFARASALLSDIDRVTHEFHDVIEVDISGAVDLAWSVLRDSRRQYALREIDELIKANDLAAAEEGIWTVLQEGDMSSAEMSALRSDWRKINRDANLKKLLSEIDDEEFFALEMTEKQASETLELHEDFADAKFPDEMQTYMLGISAAAAMRLGDNDQATSLTRELRNIDTASTITKAVNRLLQKQIQKKLENETPLLETTNTDVTTGSQ